MRSSAIVSAALALTLAVNGCIGQPATKTFHAELSGSHEVPPVDTRGSGNADFSLDPESKRLTWTMSYQGLTSEAVAAHIHGPARPGYDAAVLIDLAPNGMSNPLQGSMVLTTEQIDYLLLRRCYINIDTRRNAAGEIRGQIEP